MKPLALACALAAAGCETKPLQPAPAPQEQPLAQYMAEAAKASTDRMAAKERDTYRTAARIYPTAKEPWAKLAESYFEEGDYGNAILAAQEVLQRDANDQTASGVLVVSGLRVSTQALQSLRTQNTNLQADTRSQAEGLTKMLREVLGGVELVPRQTTTGPSGPAAAASGSTGRSTRRPVVRQPDTPRAPQPPASAATTRPPPARNPLDVIR